MISVLKLLKVCVIKILKKFLMATPHVTILPPSDSGGGTGFL